MQDPKTRRRRLIKRLMRLFAAGWLFVGPLGLILAAPAGGTGEESPAWAAPASMSLARISPVDTAQHESGFLNNLDCTLTEYRLVTDKTMQTGCFAPTAFGLLDSDSGMVIFNGTDEALPLIPYLPYQVPVAWPNALDMVALEAAPTGGSYIGLYKNPLAVLKDRRNGLLQLTGKQLTAGPDLYLRSSDGRQLVINPQTPAFSETGSWLVAETLGGYFVRVNLATLDMTPFAPAYVRQGSPELLNSEVAVSDDGRYVAIANTAAVELKVYDLSACSQTCAAHDYFSFARQRINGLQGVRHLRFVNEGLLSFEARTADPASGGVYELAPRGTIGPLTDYLGLGDSYTSGEGAFDYLAGTDTADSTCHLSANSYPLLLTRALFSNAGGHSVACSGAVINDLGSDSQDYRGQIRDGYSYQELQGSHAALLNSIMANYLPGYVAQQRFARQYQPAVMTVSAGGDDIGFGDIVANCVMPHLGSNDCYSSYEDRRELTDLIDQTVPRWAALYKRLAAASPGSRVYAIGYPQIAATGGGCALNVHLSQNEREFAADLIDYLDDHIRRAADDAGVTYVDISQALAGHRLCETAGYDVAINGLTAGKDFGILGVEVLGRESYHPNALGHALIEQAILEQTRNLTLRPAAPVVNSGQNVLNRPKTGRAIKRRQPARLTTGIVRRGKKAAVKTRGRAAGLKPRTVYTVRLGGAGGAPIGTVVSDDSGDIAGEVTIPEGAEPGGQTIDLTGDEQTDEPVDLSQPVYVPVGDDDADGDGVIDGQDSCPMVANSGQDVDRDGVDDTCDSLVVPPLATGQGGTAVPPDNGSPNSGPGGAALDGGSATIVTVLAPDTGQAGIALPDKVNKQPAAGLPATARAAGGAVRALGNLTLDPATIPGPVAKIRGPAGVGFGAAPKVINWAMWTAPLIFCWLILLLLYCWQWLYQKRQVSITMDA